MDKEHMTAFFEKFSNKELNTAYEILKGVFTGPTAPPLFEKRKERTWQKLVYVVGPYTAYQEKGRYELGNWINEIRKQYLFHIWESGAIVVCPHLNSAFMNDYAALTPDEWRSAYAKLVHQLTLFWGNTMALFMLPGWEQSKGSLIEKETYLTVMEENGNEPNIFDSILDIKTWASQD